MLEYMDYTVETVNWTVCKGVAILNTEMGSVVEVPFTYSPQKDSLVMGGKVEISASVLAAIHADAVEAWKANRDMLREKD